MITLITLITLPLSSVILVQQSINSHQVLTSTLPRVEPHRTRSGRCATLLFTDYCTRSGRCATLLVLVSNPYLVLGD